ncbi:MAG: hypothetical protein ISR55_04500 [Bacteroidetes bacterium]|nr:hypothetical protein [Bacteroidota bacterium]MBL6963059.1 hypothetical protein [Bacteroidota bacterium]
MNVEKTELKKSNFSVEEYTDEILKDPVKNAIIGLLYEKGGCFFGDIIQELKFPYDLILQNLLELKNLGIISKKSEPSHFVLN